MKAFPHKDSQRFSITLKYLKDAKVVIYLAFQFNWPVWPIQKTAGPSQMARNNYKHNQMVVLVIIRASDMVFPLGQINILPGIWNTTIQQIFFPLFLSSEHVKISPGRDKSTLTQSGCRGVSTLRYGPQVIFWDLDHHTSTKSMLVYRDVDTAGYEEQDVMVH